MFTELERASYPLEFKGEIIRLRYDIAALLRLERRSLSYEDIFADRITGAQLCAFLEEGGNLPARAEEILRELGAAEVWRHIRCAVLLSLPKHDPLILDFPKPGAQPDMKRLRCLVCDIMRKPDSFFWHSTLRELLERWQEYAVVKGLAKVPERMEMFDVEGME